MYKIMFCLPKEKYKVIYNEIKLYAKRQEVEIEYIKAIEVPKNVSFNQYTALICEPQNISYTVFTPIAFYCDQLDTCIPFMFSRPCGILRSQCLSNDLDVFLNRLINKKTVKCKGGTFLIPITEIIYVESEGHYININTTYSKIRERKKISEFIDENESGWLLRVSQSYIVNLMNIKKISNGALEMSNGEEIKYSSKFITEEIVQLISNKRG